MKIKNIKVLNIAQPNAHYVIYRGKNVENRNMRTKYRGTIAIYGSKTIHGWRFEKSWKHKVSVEDCSFGAIIGFVDLIACISENEVSKKTKKWFSGPYGYVLDNFIPLENPIYVNPPKGAVVWWNLKGANLKKCLSQISAVKRKKIVPAE